MVSYHNRKIIYLIGGKRHDHHLKTFYGDLAFHLTIVSLQNKVSSTWSNKMIPTSFWLVSLFWKNNIKKLKLKCTQICLLTQCCNTFVLLRKHTSLYWELYSKSPLLEGYSSVRHHVFFREFHPMTRVCYKGQHIGIYHTTWSKQHLSHLFKDDCAIDFCILKKTLNTCQH